MARKMTFGRSGEQLMNDRLFNAYNIIKYVGNGNATPVQQYQTPILDRSLWLDRKSGFDILKDYHLNSNTWEPMFKGYYHPAGLREQPESPVFGQVFIDNNGVLRYFEDNRWKVVKASATSEADFLSNGTTNFLLIPNMHSNSMPIPNIFYDSKNDMSYIVDYGTNQVEIKKATEEDKVKVKNNNFCRDYLVPYSHCGKLFDNKKYISTDKYLREDIKITYPADYDSTSEGLISWVHVNPSFLSDTKKRLIKIVDEYKTDYIINLSTVNTEFYGFKKGDCTGRLLRYIQDYSDTDIASETTDTISDYRIVSGGIQLINKGREYEYIYAITYYFDTCEKDVGYVLSDNYTVGDNNNVFIGQINGFPLVFLGGTYLNQEDYTYNKKTGMLTFTGETITNELDLTVAAFANVVRYTTADYPGVETQERPPFEVTVKPNNIASNGNATVQHEYIKQAKNFKHPIAFVQGISALYDPEYGITDEIKFDFDKGEVTIIGIGPLEHNIKVLIADIGDAAMSGGYTKTNKIIDSRISSDKNYLVFINGICTSPKDHEISEGQITINGLITDEQYVLMSLDKGDAGIDLLFDSPVSYFTVQIDDHNAEVVYNDCSMATCYISDSEGDVNGILIDQTGLTKNDLYNDPFITGEIVRLKQASEDNDWNTYEYEIFNVKGDYEWQLYKDAYNLTEEQELEKIITQFTGTGSISIMSNEIIKDKKLTYYAYTYCDQIDEKMLVGYNKMHECAIDHIDKEKQTFYLPRTHIYSSINKGVLSTFMNGMQVKNVEDPSVSCKFTIDTPTVKTYKKKWGDEADLYDMLTEITDATTLDDLKQYKTGVLAQYSLNNQLLTNLKILAEDVRDMNDMNLTTIVEKIETGETFSVDRQWLNAENRYNAFSNTYASPANYSVGTLDVFLNGVMLDRSSYSFFNNNKIMINDLVIAGGSDEFDISNEESKKLLKYYLVDDKTGKGTIKKIYDDTSDELLIEFRPDITVKKVSYQIKESTYDTNGVFSDIEYNFPNTLLNTKDVIKIYIDGLLYTGGYKIVGKDIVLLDFSLEEDPLQVYFNSHPDEYTKYKNDFGGYAPDRSRIIFEWR